MLFFSGAEIDACRPGDHGRFVEIKTTRLIRDSKVCRGVVLRCLSLHGSRRCRQREPCARYVTLRTFRLTIDVRFHVDSLVLIYFRSIRPTRLRLCLSTLLFSHTLMRLPATKIAPSSLPRTGRADLQEAQDPQVLGAVLLGRREGHRSRVQRRSW